MCAGTAAVSAQVESEADTTKNVTSPPPPPPHNNTRTYLYALISLSNRLATLPLPFPPSSSQYSQILPPTRNPNASPTCAPVFRFRAANASRAAGAKAASRADARFASWAPVHLDSRRRRCCCWRAGCGGGVGGAWMLGMDGCFGAAGGMAVGVWDGLLLGRSWGGEGGL